MKIVRPLCTFNCFCKCNTIISYNCKLNCKDRELVRTMMNNIHDLVDGNIKRAIVEKLEKIYDSV